LSLIDTFIVTNDSRLVMVTVGAGGSSVSHVVFAAQAVLQ
jgi:hypothetical protein